MEGMPGKMSCQASSAVVANTILAVHFMSQFGMSYVSQWHQLALPQVWLRLSKHRCLHCLAFLFPFSRQWPLLMQSMPASKRHLAPHVELRFSVCLPA